MLSNESLIKIKRNTYKTIQILRYTIYSTNRSLTYESKYELHWSFMYLSRAFHETAGFQNVTKAGSQVVRKF